MNRAVLALSTLLLCLQPLICLGESSPTWIVEETEGNVLLRREDGSERPRPKVLNAEKTPGLIQGDIIYVQQEAKVVYFDGKEKVIFENDTDKPWVTREVPAPPPSDSIVGRMLSAAAAKRQQGAAAGVVVRASRDPRVSLLVPDDGRYFISEPPAAVVQIEGAPEGPIEIVLLRTPKGEPSLEKEVMRAKIPTGEGEHPVRLDPGDGEVVWDDDAIYTVVLMRAGEVLMMRDMEKASEGLASSFEKDEEALHEVLVEAKLKGREAEAAHRYLYAMHQLIYPRE